MGLLTEHKTGNEHSIMGNLSWNALTFAFSQSMVFGCYHDNRSKGQTSPDYVRRQHNNESLAKPCEMHEAVRETEQPSFRT